jgi:protein TonB
MMKRLPPGWLLLSIALHLPILAAITHERIARESAPVLQVALIAEPAGAPTPRVTQRIETLQTGTPVHRIKQTRPVERATIPQPIPLPRATLHERTPGNPPIAMTAQFTQPASPAGLPHGNLAQTLSRTSAEQHLTLRLLDVFARYFEYPKLAKRRGWEGLVKVQLRIEPDGQLSHIELAASSGYPTLDQAALASARRIEPLHDATPWLNGRAYDLIVPVKYGLTDT